MEAIYILKNTINSLPEKNNYPTIFIGKSLYKQIFKGSNKSLSNKRGKERHYHKCKVKLLS